MRFWATSITGTNRRIESSPTNTWERFFLFGIRYWLGIQRARLSGLLSPMFLGQPIRHLHLPATWFLRYNDASPTIRNLWNLNAKLGFSSAHD